MKTPKTNVFKSLKTLDQTRSALLKIHQGNPKDSEFDDLIELIDSMMQGPNSLGLALQKRGMAHLDTKEIIERLNQRILHFYDLGNP
jgi:hypothetical protein